MRTRSPPPPPPSGSPVGFPSVEAACAMAVCAAASSQPTQPGCCGLTAAHPSRVCCCVVVATSSLSRLVWPRAPSQPQAQASVGTTRLPLLLSLGEEEAAASIRLVTAAVADAAQATQTVLSVSVTQAGVTTTPDLRSGAARVQRPAAPLRSRRFLLDYLAPTAARVVVIENVSPPAESDGAPDG